MVTFPKLPLTIALSSLLAAATVPAMANPTPPPPTPLPTVGAEVVDAQPLDDGSDDESINHDPAGDQPLTDADPTAPEPLGPGEAGEDIQVETLDETSQEEDWAWTLTKGADQVGKVALPPDHTKNAPARYDFAPGASLVRGVAKLGTASTRTTVTRIAPDAKAKILPVLAGGSKVRGLQTVPQMSKRTNALMMVNGGFWRSGPGGNPNGTWIVNRELLSEPESQGVGPRGTIGWLPDGRVLVDRISANLSVTGPNNEQVTVNGINRDWRTTRDATSDTANTTLVYSAAYGDSVKVAVPPKSSDNRLITLRIRANAFPSNGTLSATVIGRAKDPGTYRLPAGDMLITARGKAAGTLANIQNGQTIRLNAQLIPMDKSRTNDWANVVHAVAGGPMILKGGKPTASADWVSEGFEPGVHSNVRHPRTAIGRTANNETVIVTGDGRQPGRSAGFTIKELANYMASLGVVEAVSLDGGGSTQVTVGSNLVNTPCCDKPLRSVANGIAVMASNTQTPAPSVTTQPTPTPPPAPKPLKRSERIRGPERIATAAAVATKGYTKGKTPTVVLARADAYPDALSGAGLAASVGGPVLLTHRDQLPDTTLEAIRYLGTTHVAVLGGRAAVGDAVINQLQAHGLTPVRMSGPGRADTAAAVARSIATQQRQVGKKVEHAFIVAGDQWADALVAGAPSGMLKSPILLTNASKLDQVTADIIKELGIKRVTLVGSTDRLGPGVEQALSKLGLTVNRIGKASVYATSVAMNEWLATKVKKLDNGLVVATGESFPDGLAAAPFAARHHVPLILVPGKQVQSDPTVTTWITNTTNSKTKLYVLGGTKVIPDDQLHILDGLGATKKGPKAAQTPTPAEPGQVLALPSE